MAAFDYQAIDSKGKSKSGVLEGDTARQVRSMLREQGLVPLEVNPTLKQQKSLGSSKVKRTRKISAGELALLTRQLATLVESGLPIEESLMAVAEQTEKAQQKSMMMAVRSKVTEGYSLAESMAEFPQVFSNLYRAMVAAGEKSGHLDKVLNRLADYTEQRQQLKSQLVQALVYPAIMTLVAVSVIVILLTVVVPKIVAQFEHLGHGLPDSTLLLIGISEFLRNYGLILLVLALVCVVGFKRLMKKPKLRLAYHQKQLNLPVIGKVIRGLNTARFARTLSILTASAVPLLEAMKIAGEVLDNGYIKLKVAEAADMVREGTSLRLSLERSKLFPPMMLHMIASGEKSGELEQMLGRAADNQDREFEALMNISIKAFEPALMIVMAVVVLFIVLAILQPLLQLNTLVGS